MLPPGLPCVNGTASSSPSTRVEGGTGAAAAPNPRTSYGKLRKTKSQPVKILSDSRRKVRLGTIAGCLCPGTRQVAGRRPSRVATRFGRFIAHLINACSPPPGRFQFRPPDGCPLRFLPGTRSRGRHSLRWPAAGGRNPWNRSR
jgi:hypothetical protein